MNGFSKVVFLANTMDIDIATVHMIASKYWKGILDRQYSISSGFLWNLHMIIWVKVNSRKLL